MIERVSTSKQIYVYSLGKVDADLVELSGPQSFLSSFADLASLHVGGLIEGHQVGRNLQIGLKGLIEVPAAVPIPEESHMLQQQEGNTDNSLDYDYFSAL